MIDTISLTIDQMNFNILDHNRFSTNTEHLFKYPYIRITGSTPFKSFNNPSKADIEKYGYLPRLTIFKAIRRGGFAIFLRVEFSIPKLLHENNFDEVNESDFGEICWRLKDKVLKMGVNINNVNTIITAEVSSIHYSKNIILSDHTTPYTYLDEVRKINVNHSLDTNQTDFRNEGHAVKYRSNDFEVILYDKLKDLEQSKKSEKRAIESDNYIQLELFEEFKPKTPFQVLRIEVRIGSRRKLKQLLKKYEIANKQMNFNDLFCKDLSQRVLLSTVNDIENAYPKILTLDMETFKSMANELQLNNPELNYTQLLKYIGASALLRETGVREFRQMTGRFGDSQWYRLNRGMKRLKLGKNNDIFGIIRRAIEDFEQIELVKYKDKL